MTTCYQAYGSNGCSIVAPTPRQAARGFFLHFPNHRKCNIIQGKHDGQFFTVVYGNPWPKSWKDIAKKGVDALPDTTDGE